MKRQDLWLASRALYAVDLSGLTRSPIGKVEATHQDLYRYEIPAAWFKRRRGVDTANIGRLWDISTDVLVSPAQLEGILDACARRCFIEAEARKFLTLTLTDGRFGGSCRSRWDGARLWSDPAITLEEQRDDQEFLDRMLAAIPAVPPGFDGWWSFEKHERG